MKKIALITGASSGIGKATAETFARNHINLIICGRRQERLEQIAKELAPYTEVLTLCFDVRDKQEVDEILDTLPSQWQNIDFLVNNAGNAHGLEPIHTGSISDWDAMIDINVYCASKFAVDAITQGMRMDLNPFGIKVSQVAPGLVETEFSLVRFKGDAERAKKVYEGYQPLTAQDIADTIWYIASAPAHVQIADLVILPTAQASATIVKKDTY